MWFGGESDLIPSPDAGIILIDFEESFFPSATSRCFSRLPHNFIPPEIFFSEESLSFPVDIWALGCVIWGIMGRGLLFDYFPSTCWVIQEYIDVLGELPPEWSQKWDVMPKWLNAGEDDECWSWEKRFEFNMQKPRQKLGMKKVGEEEKAAFLVMLKAMVTYNPGERMTAEEVRQSKWMTKWAMPELLSVDFLLPQGDPLVVFCSNHLSQFTV